MDNEVLERVMDFLPAVNEAAWQTEQDRKVPHETIRALIDAGFFRMLQPRRYGGTETNPIHFYEVVRAISGACGSSGWVASVLGVHPWHLALFDDRAQADVWGENPDTLISSSYAPIAELQPGPGGYEISGSWRFSSGVDHCGWVLLGGTVDSDTAAGDTATLLLPRGDYEIRDVWDSVGLRGTGSNEIVVDRAFVPEHRVMRNVELSRLRGPGQTVNTGPLYRIPFATVFTLAIASPVLGVVAGCYEAYVDSMRERVRLSLGGGRFVDDKFAQVMLGRASSEIDASILQMDATSMRS